LFVRFMRDSAVNPGMLDLGQAMFNAILFATHIEHMRRVSCGRSACVTRWESELDSTVGGNRVDLVGGRRDQNFEEVKAEFLPVFLTSCTKANLLDKP
jgi:hypothetical protein